MSFKGHTSLLVVLGAVLTTGCASITRGSKDTLTVLSEPSGAECSLSNGYHCPSTPCAIKMPRRSEGVITCRKEGYSDASGTFTYKASGAGAAGMAGNVLVGGIIGAGVDAATGAMNDLTPNPITIELEPLPPITIPATAQERTTAPLAPPDEPDVVPADSVAGGSR